MMRKMLFLLLLLPVFGLAQSAASVTAFRQSRPDSLGTTVPSLDTKKWTRLYLVRELGMKRKYIYTLSTEQEYRTVFGFDPADSLPVFDFSKQELIVYAACGQCMVYCHHHGLDHEPCHRNACIFQEAWYVRDKKLDLITVN